MDEDSGSSERRSSALDELVCSQTSRAVMWTLTAWIVLCSVLILGVMVYFVVEFISLQSRNRAMHRGGHSNGKRKHRTSQLIVLSLLLAVIETVVRLSYLWTDHRRSLLIQVYLYCLEVAMVLSIYVVLYYLMINRLRVSFAGSAYSVSNGTVMRLHSCMALTCTVVAIWIALEVSEQGYRRRSLVLSKFVLILTANVLALLTVIAATVLFNQRLILLVAHSELGSSSASRHTGNSDATADVASPSLTTNQRSEDGTVTSTTTATNTCTTGDRNGTELSVISNSPVPRMIRVMTATLTTEVRPISEFDAVQQGLLLVSAKQSVISTWVCISFAATCIAGYLFSNDRCWDGFQISGNVLMSASIGIGVISASMGHKVMSVMYDPLCSHCDSLCRLFAALFVEQTIVDLRLQNKS